MTKNILVKRIMLFILCLALTTSIISATGKVNAEGNGAEFYVSAQLPDNQQDEKVNYFDLKMKPEQKQTVYVNLYNEKDEEMNISVYAANASSNTNGIIEYTKQGITDESLKVHFEEIAKPKQNIVTVPASGTKSVAVDITMPEEKFDGTVLGGLVFTEVKDEKQEKKEEASVSISNEVSYALAFKLNETDKNVDLNMDLLSVEPKVVNYEPVITHNIHNSAAVLSTKMKMDIKIIDEKTGEIVTEDKNERVSIAPNSLMPYSLRLKGTNLNEGNYISKVTIDYKDAKDNPKKAEFEKAFSIDKDDASKINDYKQDKQESPLWAKILIACLIVFTAAIVTLIFIVVRKRKNVQKIK